MSHSISQTQHRGNRVPFGQPVLDLWITLLDFLDHQEEGLDGHVLGDLLVKVMAQAVFLEVRQQAVGIKEVDHLHLLLPDDARALQAGGVHGVEGALGGVINASEHEHILFSMQDPLPLLSSPWKW